MKKTKKTQHVKEMKRKKKLGEVQLNNMIRICVEGPTVTDFNPLPAIKLWAKVVLKRTKGKSSCVQNFVIVKSHM